MTSPTSEASTASGSIMTKMAAANVMTLPINSRRTASQRLAMMEG